MKKRFLSIFLALAMALTLLPVSAFAEDATIVASGECGAQGDNVTWTLDSEGTLTISGEGEMVDYVPHNYSPWHDSNYVEKVKTVVITDNVTSIGSYAFYGCMYVTSATISGSVTCIKEGAFFSCHSLEEVTDLSNVTSIGSQAFEACEKLTNITLPEGITSIEDYVFRDCRSLRNVNIPSTVTKIGNCAFLNCASLSNITIPDGVTYTGPGAFFGCSSITAVTIPANLTDGLEGDFQFCNSLQKIEVSPQNPMYTSEDGIVFNKSMTRLIHYPSAKSTKNYEIPDTVTSIYSNAFSRCYNLNKLIIPASVVNLEMDTFNYNGWRTAGPIGGGYDVEFGWTEAIPDLAFNGCSLTSITIPISISSIGSATFGRNDQLIAVNYEGSKTQWSKITGNNLGNQKNITIHYALADIMYENGGGLGTADSSVTEKGATIVLPTCGFTAPAGKAFKAWSINGVECAPGSSYTVTDDITITATWKDIDTPITPPEVPDKYIVSYDANGGTGTMDSDIVEKGTPFALPACGFTAPADKEFKAWQISNTEYNPNDVYAVTADTTVTAVWQTIPTVGYTLTGTITGHKGVTYTSVTAQLVGLNGSTYSAELGAGVVDKTGKTEYAYTVAALAGQYTLEVEARTDTGGVVNRSAVVKLTGNGQTKDINLPNGQAKVKVENKLETAALVGGLDELIIDADGEVKGEVTLTIGSVDNSDPAVAAIRNAAPGRTLEFMDISITKSENGVESAVTDTGDATVEIVLAFDRTGKNDIAVYRYHDGSVDTLTTQVSGDGEKIEVDDDSIAIYAKKFSVYAIGYTVSATDPTTPSNPTTPSRPSSSSSSSSYSISISTNITGGTVTAQPTSASAGSKVTVTATPNSGYELDTLTVTNVSGNRVSLTNQGNNQYTFTMPSGKVTVDAVFSKIWSNPFTDVATSAWYYGAVKFVNQNGLMNGVGNGLFAPGTHLSRAMLAEILYNKEGRPIVTTASSFSDVVAGAWYANAVTWAATKNIVGGYGNGLFGPGDDITREQFAVILYRYAGSPVPPNLLLDFTDAYKVSDWAQDAIRWAVGQGILNGKGNGVLDPTGKATRAEAAQMLKNYLEK